jgi:hypothetical protein
MHLEDGRVCKGGRGRGRGGCEHACIYICICIHICRCLSLSWPLPPYPSHRPCTSHRPCPTYAYMCVRVSGRILHPEGAKIKLFFTLMVSFVVVIVIWMERFCFNKQLL